MYIRCIYGIFGRKITKYTVIYGVYIQIWPTLHIPNASSFFGSGTLTSAPSRISGARYQSVTTRGVIAEGNGWKYLHQQQMFFREDERSNMDRAPATSILSTTSMWVTSGLPSCCAVSCNMYHATKSTRHCCWHKALCAHVASPMQSSRSCRKENQRAVCQEKK